MSHGDITSLSTEEFENRRQYIILATAENKNNFKEMT